MRDFPSCFGESGVQVSDSSSGSSKTAQNLVTCLYQVRLFGRPCVINATWSRSLMGQGLSVGIDDLDKHCLCKVEIKPWLFSKRKGSKILEVESSKIVVFWDLSSAKFGPGPEPLEGFYVAVVLDQEMVLLLGDLTKEAYRKSNASPPPSNAVLVAKREHIYGKKLYSTKAKFCDNGQSHEVVIECDTVGLKDPCLEIRVDRKRVMQVKRLAWKFRGNQTILVDGLPVEVFWDVHNWLFGPPTGGAVFMFQTCLSAEKLLPWSTSKIFRETQSQDDCAAECDILQCDCFLDEECNRADRQRRVNIEKIQRIFKFCTLLLRRHVRLFQCYAYPCFIREDLNNDVQTISDKRSGPRLAQNRD